MEDDNAANETSGGTLTREGYLATGVYVMIIGMTGTIGNVVVVFTLLKFWSRRNIRRKPHLPFVLSLAVSDLFITVFGYPYSSASGFAGKWLFNSGVCRMVGFSCFFFSMASLDILVAVSVYRYIAICRPELTPRLSLKTSGYVISACWVYALVWALPPLLGLSEYSQEPFGTSCSMNWASRKIADLVFLAGTVVFCFLIHIIIMIVCYYKIYKKYRKITSSLKEGGTGPVFSKQIRITIISLMLVTLFFIAWSPYAIVCTWEVVSNGLPAAASVLPTMFAKSSCVFNPILYGLCDKHFRQIAKRCMCPCLFKHVGIAHDHGRYQSRYPRNPKIFTVETCPPIELESLEKPRGTNGSSLSQEFETSADLCEPPRRKPEQHNVTLTEVKGQPIIVCEASAPSWNISNKEEPVTPSHLWFEVCSKPVELESAVESDDIDVTLTSVHDSKLAVIRSSCQVRGGRRPENSTRKKTPRSSLSVADNKTSSSLSCRPHQKAKKYLAPPVMIRDPVVIRNSLQCSPMNSRERLTKSRLSESLVIPSSVHCPQRKAPKTVPQGSMECANELEETSTKSDFANRNNSNIALTHSNSPCDRSDVENGSFMKTSGLQFQQVKGKSKGCRHWQKPLENGFLHDLPNTKSNISLNRVELRSYNLHPEVNETDVSKSHKTKYH